MNLREFVELWKTTMTLHSPPTAFISQKLTPEQDEKVETIVTPYLHHEGCVLYSIDRLSGTHDPRPLYRYKFIPSENTANFQVKPPVKTSNSDPR